MDFFTKLDKLNFPTIVCSDDWNIVYRNRACKKYTTSPRVNSKFDRCFLDKESTVFPEKNGAIDFVGCFIQDKYKTALCFEYKGYALVMFPLLLDFDLLFANFVNQDKADFAESLRNILDALCCDFSEMYDKYSMLEKIRKYAYSVIDNYVTLSMFDTEKRVNGSVYNIYKFLCDNIVKTANKTGYKIESDFSEIEEFGTNVYTDTMYFSMIVSGILLFCLSVSSDKKCRIEAEHSLNFVRNKITFTRKVPVNNGFKTLMELNPAEYINFIPFEELCRSLGWELHCHITEDETMNVSMWFDIDVDNKIIFRSPGNAKIVTPEEIMLTVFMNTFMIR